MSFIPDKGRPADTLEGARRSARDAAELLARERQVRRRLERESEIRDRLIALLVGEVVAHARVVLGWSGLMRREPLDGKAREIALQKIESSGHAQLATVDELVDVAAIASAALSLDCAAVDLGRVARDVARDVGDRRMIVEPDAPPELFVFADPTQLARIVRSLLPAAPDAGPRSFRLALVDEGRTAVVHVRKEPADNRNDVHVAKELVQVYGGNVRLADDGSIVLSLPTCEPPGADPVEGGRGSD